MKKMIAILALVSTSSTVFANDGGIAAIKVDQIKMREMAIKNGEQVIVNRISKPSYKIIIEGGEAAKLQKILPSTSSVFTGMHPGEAKTYKESFKSLGIYSDKSTEASGKAITISCSDAVIGVIGGSDDDRVIKTGKSVCTIEINAVEEGADLMFGDMQTFEPKSCK